MALVQSQQSTGSGLGTFVPGPLLFVKQGARERGSEKTGERVTE